MAISDDRRNPSASPNWLAMIDAMEFPVAVMELGMLFVLPMSIVTVIVSPSALPMASMYDENIPAPATGKIILCTISARVAPRL